MPNDAVKKEIRERKYLNKTFEGFQKDLLDYARTYYGNRIKDFSDSSLGGMFLDLASYVGDSTAFYLDHQFSELNPLEAIESVNVESHLQNAGIEITGAAAAVVYVDFTISIPVSLTDATKIKADLLPIIRKNTTVGAENGVEFFLLEDIDFSETDKNGNYLAKIVLDETDADGLPLSYAVTRQSLCVSGQYIEETFSLGTFTAFRKIVLSNQHVTLLMAVYDDEGNIYHEVNDLSEDTIYKAITNKGVDNDLVKDTLVVIPAPYRFKRTVDLSSRTTTLTFGGGSAETLEDDIIPDPSQFALPLYGKKTFPITSINPNNLLKTKTLGITAVNTTLHVNYYAGGGLSHNVEVGAISELLQVIMDFPTATSIQQMTNVKSSMTVTNNTAAAGGDDPPDVDTLRALIPQANNSQSRIVSKEDLLARIYTLPANFGRVFRAAIRPNITNPNAAELYVVSKDSSSNLSICTDTLKNNIRTYINQYRLISDAIDILDARVINLQLQFEVSVDTGFQKQQVMLQILKSLKRYFEIANFHIDQPIVISDIISLIYSANGVVAVNNRNNSGMVKFTNLVGTVNGRSYSTVSHDIEKYTIRGLLVPPPGGIFEIKYPDIDIISV